MALLACPAGGSAQAPITAAPEALISMPAATGWTAAAELRLGSREFVAAGELLETDLRTIGARVGFHLLPFLQPWVEAGTSKADRSNFDGENGLFWGAGLHADLVEWVVQGNPSLPRKRVVNLGGLVAYRSFESNFADADFTWGELEVAPGLTYTSNRLGDATWTGYQPLESTLRGHVVFSHIDGDFGTRTVEGNRDFGFRLGLDLFWNNAVHTAFEGTFYGDQDRLLGLRVGYHF